MKKLILMCLILAKGFTAHAQWQEVSVTTNSSLKDVLFLDENNGFIVGGGDIFNSPNATDGVIYKTIDAGETWTEVFVQENTSINYIVNINNEIIAFGTSGGNDYKFVSTDNGETWVSSHLPYNVYDVRTTGNTIFFRENHYSSILKKIENDAISVVAEDVGKYGVNNNEIVYVNSIYNTIFKSDNYGETFNALPGYPEDFSENQSSGAVLKSFGDTITVHYTYPPTTHYSLDNGSTWTLVYGGGLNCQIVSNNLIITGQHKSIHKQIDFGSWQLETTLEEGDEIRKIYIYNENLGFVVGDNGLIYKTTNVEGMSINDFNLEKAKIKISPNPATDSIFIENTGNLAIQRVELRDLSGKKVKTISVNTSILDISNLSNGTYLLQIFTQNGKFTEKIIKK